MPLTRLYLLWHRLLRVKPLAVLDFGELMKFQLRTILGRRQPISQLIYYFYIVLTMPFAITTILYSNKIHRSYGITVARRFTLGFEMFLNNIRIPSGTTYKLHLAMAMKLLETPPEVSGDVIECGTWKGGSAANLSLVCRITGRKLRIFDSFQGLPEPDPKGQTADAYKRGDWRGTLQEVKENIRKYGAAESCLFVPGWFHETLPGLDSPVLLAFIDVDLVESLDTCVRFIWPRLVDGGLLFIDEAVDVSYCALFYSEKWWASNFGQEPPGLIGAGTGLPLGTYYVGPWSERESHPLQHQGTGAYTQKGMLGHWDYYPTEGPATERGQAGRR